MQALLPSSQFQSSSGFSASAYPVLPARAWRQPVARSHPNPARDSSRKPCRAASLFSLLRGQCHDSFSSSLSQARGLLSPVTVAPRAALSQHGRLVLVRLVLYILVPRPPAHLQSLLREPRRLDLDADFRNLHDISHLHRRLCRAASLAPASRPRAPGLLCHNVRSASRQVCAVAVPASDNLCLCSSAIESSSKTLPKNGLCIWDPGKWWGLSSDVSVGNAATRASCSNTFVSAKLTSLPSPRAALYTSSSIIAITITISNNYTTLLPTIVSFLLCHLSLSFHSSPLPSILSLLPILLN